MIILIYLLWYLVNLKFYWIYFFTWCWFWAYILHTTPILYWLRGVFCGLKFGLPEKHSKFEKNLRHGFDKSADLLSKRQNHEEDFFKICVLLRKSERVTTIFTTACWIFFSLIFKAGYFHFWFTAIISFLFFKVIDFYNKKLEPMKEGTLGVEEMQEFIRQTAIQFPTEKLKVKEKKTLYSSHIIIQKYWGIKPILLHIALINKIFTWL